MKFLLALFALVAYASAQYVAHTSYVSPVVHTGNVGAYHPYAVHYRNRRQLYTPVHAAPVAYTGYYPYAHGAVHFRERRQIYSPVYTPVAYAHHPFVYYRERRQVPGLYHHGHHGAHHTPLAYNSQHYDNHFAHHY